jgi:hypothetical protein
MPVCAACASDLPNDAFGKKVHRRSGCMDVCLSCARAALRQRYGRWKNAGRCVRCGRPPRKGKYTCSRCAQKAATNYAAGEAPAIEARKLAYVRQARADVMRAYGGAVCTCCGDTHEEFLSIDHIDGGGSAHRRKLKGKGGHGFYLWLRKHNYPPGYRVLCMNCNFARGMRGYCPHEKEQRMEKYSVVTDPPVEKKAGEDTLCPRCGNVVRPALDTGVLLCLKCGSAPFEEATDGKP